jgi:hypothetical protein
MGKIDLKEIHFSKQVQSEWSDVALWEKLLKGTALENPTKV